MNSSLILSVARCDLQRVMDLLCEGAEPDLVTREGSPLLHLALSHEDPEAALAMTQLLLVHGGEDRGQTRGDWAHCPRGCGEAREAGDCESAQVLWSDGHQSEDNQ